MASDGLFEPQNREEEWQDFFNSQGDLLNTTIRQLGGVSHQINEADELCNLLDSLDSDAFWNDMLNANDQCNKAREIKTHTAPIAATRQKIVARAAAGLEAITECSDSYERLYEGQEKVIEFLNDQNINLNVVEPQPEDLSACYDQVKSFTGSDQFWNEIIGMEAEAGAESKPTIVVPQEEETVPSSTTTSEFTQKKRNFMVYPPAVELEIETKEEEKKEHPEVTTPLLSTTTAEETKEQVGLSSKSNTLLTTSNLWDDVKVMSLDPHSQLVIDKSTICDNPILSSMAEEIETRSLKGPSVKYSFLTLAIAAVSIVLISASHSVRESPLLFRILWALAFMINFITVSIPGRLDRVLVDGQHIKPWTSLFEASPWAFAIWGLIYFAEIVLSGYVSIIGIPVKLFQKLVPYWLAGNWCQGLWCFAFRPEFKSALWVPSMFLLLGTTMFTKLHYDTTVFMRTTYGNVFTLQTASMMMLRVPFAMHAAWLAAATLINLNSFVAVARCSKGQQIAVAHASISIATAFGMYFAWITQDATMSLTMAWALEAVAHRTFEKIKAPGNVVGADVQESLAISASVMCNVMKCLSLGVMMAPFVRETV